MTEATQSMDATVDDVVAIANELGRFLAAKPHATALAALLLVFKATALRHTCWTRGASMACAALAIELGNAAGTDLGLIPTGHQVH